jgi:predicted CXXCH cytochrome family protein
MLLAAGNENAPTCMDCHNPHTQPPIEEVSKVNFAQVCAQCHNGIYEEYTTSVHGAALLEGNQDVPGCVDCHGVHSIADPTTAEFRNSSIYMCANCHTDESIMGKYDLSTAVLDTYVADFHGTTVTIFEETEPGQLTNKAVCYDCHGIHNILSVTDPNKGIAVKENMLLACQKCHPDATTNFPDSWLSHYRPDREKFPIVYYVDLFYKIFIPVVLGGMAIFVLSDIYFRIRSRFQKPAAESVSESKDVEKE